MYGHISEEHGRLSQYRHHSMGRNEDDMKDEMHLTDLALASPHRVPRVATRSVSARRSSTRKRERPRPTLRYGSAGTKSVHPTGTEQRDPSGRSTVTRSSPHSCLATTNRNVWPRRGWNGWTIRISGGSTASAVVDGFGEGEGGGGCAPGSAMDSRRAPPPPLLPPRQAERGDPRAPHAAHRRWKTDPVTPVVAALKRSPATGQCLANFLTLLGNSWTREIFQ